MHFTPWFDRFGFDGRIIAESKFNADCNDDYERFLNQHGYSRKDLYDQQSDDYVSNCSTVESRVPAELHIDSFVGASVCEYIEKTDGPFFAFASFLSPHNPYDPPAPYDTMFDDVNLPPRNMGANETVQKPDVAYNYINDRLPWPYKSDEITDEQVRTMKKAYYGLNTLVDDWVGRIVDTLKEKGIYDNTIIIYSSDHGDLLGDHGLFYKQCFYEQSAKVPLIVHAPSRFSAGRSAAMVENIDIFSTICDLGNSDPGTGRDGFSFLPLLEDPDKRGMHRKAAFSENYYGKMIRFENWKMVYYPGRQTGELYDLQDDPAEQNNLWDELHHSDIGHMLKNMLLEWAFTTEDKLPLPVRPGHHDSAPRQYIQQPNGHTGELSCQDWFLPHLMPLHQNGSFSRKWYQS